MKRKHLRPGIRIKLGKAYSTGFEKTGTRHRWQRVLFQDEQGHTLAEIDVPLHGRIFGAARIKAKARALLFASHRK